MTGRPNLLHGEDLPKLPRQKRSHEKRARLMAAAIFLYGERGYEGTSIEAITRRSKLAIGTFYQHFRSKRQLLLALMDEFLVKLSEVNLRLKATYDARAAVREVLAQAFARDLRYLGALRAWQEAVLTDRDLAQKQSQINAWTTARVTAVFEALGRMPSARSGADIGGLARAMDSLFWSLLGQAAQMPKEELDRWINSATHLIYHAMFLDAPEA